MQCARVSEAYEKACEVRLKAYVPYSKFKVGAVVKPKDSDTLFVGCNVENASLGGTICAERNAILSMIATHGASEIDFAVVVADLTPTVVPCGLCLQVFAEFAQGDMPIHLGDLQGIQRVLTLNELFPERFNGW